jgi:hypothetical protein
MGDLRVAFFSFVVSEPHHIIWVLSIEETGPISGDIVGYQRQQDNDHYISVRSKVDSHAAHGCNAWEAHLFVRFVLLVFDRFCFAIRCVISD